MHIVQHDTTARPNLHLDVLAPTKHDVKPAASTPIVSLTTLALAIAGAPISELLLRVRGHKEVGKGVEAWESLSHPVAQRQAVDFMTEGVPFDLSVTEDRHEKRAIRTLIFTPPRAPRWARALPGKRRAAWNAGGLLVDVRPDVEIDGGPRQRGAAMIHLARKPLPQGVGPTMAALLFHMLSEVSRESAIARSHCLVFEPCAQRVFSAVDGPKNVEGQVRAGVAMIAGLWNLACSESDAEIDESPTPELDVHLETLRASLDGLHESASALAKLASKVNATRAANEQHDADAHFETGLRAFGEVLRFAYAENEGD